MSGIMDFVNAHGGPYAAMMLVVGGSFTILSAFRQVLASYDGVAPGAPIPANFAGLTKLNMVCVVLGKVVDFVTGNVQH